MKYFILIPLLLLSTISYAQSVYSTAVNDVFAGYSDPLFICPLENNECLIVGSTYTTQSAHFLSHVDGQGHFLWNKTFSLAGNPLQIRQLLSLDDSSVLVSGSADQLFSLIKCNKHGDTLWSRAYAIDTGVIKHLYVKKAIDGTFLLCGFRYDNFNYSGFIGRIDSTGNVLQSAMLSSWPLFIESTTDNGLIGLTSDQHLIRLDSAFNLLWSKSYTVTSGIMEATNGFLQLSDGSLICSSPRLYFRTDSSGVILWAKQEYETYQYYGDVITNRIVQTADGNILSYLMIDCTGQIPFKMDINGNRLQSAWIWQIPAGICATSDSGFIALGGGPVCLVAPPGFSQPLNQIGLSKADANFNLSSCGSSQFISFSNQNLQVTAASLTQNPFVIRPDSSAITSDTIYIEEWYGSCVQATGGWKDEHMTSSYLYPSPTSGWVQLFGKENIASFTIENSLGSVVYRSENVNAEWIDLSALDNGMYFYRMTTFAGKPISGKVIIQH